MKIVKVKDTIVMETCFSTKYDVLVRKALLKLLLSQYLAEKDRGLLLANVILTSRYSIVFTAMRTLKNGSLTTSLQHSNITDHEQYLFRVIFR